MNFSLTLYTIFFTICVTNKLMVIKKMSKEERKEERNKPIQFYVSEREYNDIEEYSNLSNCTKSEFIRQSILDKITRIKNPEVFESKGLNGFSKEQIKQILVGTTNNNKKADLLLEKMELLIEKQKYIEIISNRLNKSELEDIDSKVEKLIQDKDVNLKDIVEILGYDESTILKVLSIKNDNGSLKYSMDNNKKGLIKINA